MVPHVSGWAWGSMSCPQPSPLHWWCSEEILIFFSRPRVLSCCSMHDSPVGMDLAFIHSTPEDFTDSLFLQALSIRDLFGRNIAKRTENAGSAVRKGVIRGTDPERNFICVFSVAVRRCFKGVFRLLNSVQRIIISILRFNVTHNCSQGQPSATELLAAVTLNRKAWTERNMGNRNEWKGRLTKHCLQNVCFYQILMENAVVCLSFDTLLFVIIS